MKRYRNDKSESWVHLITLSIKEIVAIQKYDITSERVRGYAYDNMTFTKCEDAKWGKSYVLSRILVNTYDNKQYYSKICVSTIQSYITTTKVEYVSNRMSAKRFVENT